MSANNRVLCVSCGPAPCNCVGECMEEAHQPAEPVEICRLRPRIDLELRLQPPGEAQQVPVPAGPDYAMWSAGALEGPLPQAQPSVDQGAVEMMDTEAGVAPRQSFKGPCNWDGSSLKLEGGSSSQTAHGQPEVPVPDSAGSGTNSPEQAQAEPDVDRCGGVTSTTQPAAPAAAAEQLRQALCRAARAARTEKRKVLRQLQAASLGEGTPRSRDRRRRRCSTITEETAGGEGIKSRESSVSRSASGGSGSKSPMASERRCSGSSRSGSNASAPGSEKSSSGAKESTKSASTGTSDDGKDEFRRAWLEEQQREYDAHFEEHEYQEQEGTRKRKV